MGKPAARVRYNAKARGSTAGGSLKRGKPKKQHDLPSQSDGPTGATLVDSNADIILPPSKMEEEDRIRQRKEVLKSELMASVETKMSSKKKKKLDSYINKKLKKEERVILFEKLAQSQAQIAPTALQSSSTLGSGRVRTNAERLELEQDKLVRRALDGSSGSRKRRRITRTLRVDVSDSQSEGDDSSQLGDDDDDKFANRMPTTTTQSRRSASPLVSQTPAPAPVNEDGIGAAQVSVKPLAPAVVGGGLKRNADGTVIGPKIVPRRQKPTREALRRRGKPTEADYEFGEEESDEGEDEGDSSGDSIDSSASSNAEEEDSSSANDSSDNSGEEGTEDEEPAPLRVKRAGFKDWAQRQILLAKDTGGDGSSTAPEYAAENLLERPAVPQPRLATDGLLHGPLGSSDAGVPQTSFAAAVLSRDRAAGSSSAPAQTTSRKFVQVTRTDDIQTSRLLLPVVAEEQAIIEAIRLNPVVVICGETGSGKTTQVPQFLYEAGFGSPGSENPGMIGITQPRRVAAMSMASRVASELSLPPSKVSYQIRYDATVSPSTVIKFMTDGVLLRELANDFMLKKYSVVVVDEAHERSMNTDILIGVLSRVMKLRADMWEKDRSGPVKPLRLIVMSATLRVTDFSENRTLFPTAPPIISINARQHPVTIHFNRRTPADYVTEAIRKTTKIHARLPAGGILIFLTGQDEIVTVCKKLNAKFGQKALDAKKQRRASASSHPSSSWIDDDNIDDRFIVSSRAQQEQEPEDMDVQADLDGISDHDDNGGSTDDEALDTDNEDEDDTTIDTDVSDVPMHIVPLYSLLSSENQMKAFKPPPEESRLVVVATNVAETSLTIPGVRYVIDCGRAKQREYDVQSGIQTFKITWISKASAAQRAGRAGRTGPGHCYRLYSSPVFENHFDAFSAPEILRVPIEGVVLQMKGMHIDAVANFPFPTPPDRIALKKAETLLTHLGALDFPSTTGRTNSLINSASRMTIGGHITDIGKAMSLFPVSPRFSKMLVAARKNDALPYVIAVVAALSVGNPFLHENYIQDTDGKDGENDAGPEDDDNAPAELVYIKNPELRAKEIRKLERRKFFQSQQTHTRLGNGASDVFRTLSVVGAYEYAGGGTKFCAEHFVRPKAMDEIHKLRSQISNIVQSNFPEVKADFSASLPPPSVKQLKILRQFLTAGFIDCVAVRKDLVAKNPDGTKYASSRGVAYTALDIEEDVFIHPSSVLFHSSPPDYVVFQEVVRSSRVWIKTVTTINPAWLHTLGASMCTFSKPKEVPTSMKSALGAVGNVVTPVFGGKFTLPPIRM